MIYNRGKNCHHRVRIKCGENKKGNETRREIRIKKKN